jgi:hypothetical protein
MGFYRDGRAHGGRSMGEKKKLAEAIVDGAEQGLAGSALLEHARKIEPNSSTKKVAHAAFFALTDPSLKDKAVLDAIYALGIELRLDGGAAVQEKPIAKGKKEPRRKAATKKAKPQADKGLAEPA